MAVDGSTGNKWPESLDGPANEGIDPWKGAAFHPVMTPATLEGRGEQAGANSATVRSAALRTAPAVAAAAATGRGKQWSRTKRAAEILGTSVNHQAAISSVLPTPETTSSITQQPLSSAPDSTSHTPSSTSIEASSEPATPVLSNTTTTEVSTTTSTMTSATDLLSSTQPPPSEPILHDESVQSEQEQANTTVTAPPTTTTTTTTQQQHVIGNEEYFADDAAGSTSTTDATSDDGDETTIVVVDKSPPTVATVVDAADSEHSNASTGMDETNPMTTMTSSENSRLAVSAVVAVGRALSQEESVPWPEAKSTKVIGTIIEDIHGPFSDGVSSVNASSPDVLTSSGIAAIVMCSFLVLLTTAGEQLFAFLLLLKKEKKEMVTI